MTKFEPFCPADHRPPARVGVAGFAQSELAAANITSVVRGRSANGAEGQAAGFGQCLCVVTEEEFGGCDVRIGDYPSALIRRQHLRKTGMGILNLPTGQFLDRGSFTTRPGSRPQRSNRLCARVRRRGGR